MHLSTVMNLMFEQVRKHAQTAVVLRRITGNGDDARQIVIAQLLAIGDQTSINVGLLFAQLRAVGKRLVHVEKHVAIGVRFSSAQLALQCIDVEPVAGEDVIEGQTNARKKTHPRRRQIRRTQLRPGLGQAMIGPGILVCHGQQMMG
ncbi:hypothetical protein D3C72_843990 [compost metagenome]